MLFLRLTMAKLSALWSINFQIDQVKNGDLKSKKLFISHTDQLFEVKFGHQLSLIIFFFSMKPLFSEYLNQELIIISIDKLLEVTNHSGISVLLLFTQQLSHVHILWHEEIYTYILVAKTFQNTFFFYMTKQQSKLFSFQRLLYWIQVI